MGCAALCRLRPIPNSLREEWTLTNSLFAENIFPVYRIRNSLFGRVGKFRSKWLNS